MWRSILVFLAILSADSASALPATQKPHQNQKEFVIALKPDKNPEKMLEERKALEDFLGKKLGATVKVVVPLAAAVIAEGFKNGSIDLGYFGSLDMVLAEKAKSAEVLLGGEIKGKTSYESLWVARKDKPYKSIADLKGKPIAFASRTSTSGYLVPHKALVEQGLLKEKERPEVFFGEGNVWYGTGYVSAIERVLDGTAEAAAVSDYVVLEDKHLTPAQKEALVVFQRQGPIPTHVIAVRSSLPAAEKLRLKNALLELNQKRHHMLRDQLFTSRLIEVDSRKHLASIADALRLTGADFGKL